MEGKRLLINNYVDNFCVPGIFTTYLKQFITTPINLEEIFILLSYLHNLSLKEMFLLRESWTLFANVTRMYITVCDDIRQRK